MNADAQVDISEYDQVPLAHLVLPIYAKLIKRITKLNGSVMPSGNIFSVRTIGDIAKLDPHQFAKLPAVGMTYVSSLIALQKELPSFLSISKPKVSITESPPRITLSPTQLDTPIAQLAIPAQYQKLIKRISAVAENVVTVRDLVSLDPGCFGELPAVGKGYVQNLIELQKQLPIQLDSEAKKFASLNSIEFSEMDSILIEDIENYLWALDEMKMDVALARWGFNHPHETLAEVAARYNVTREWIRQIEKPINANLPLQLTIPSKILWANIRAKMTEDLSLLLPNLAKCFATDKLFYAFIELCGQVQPGSISKIIFTKVRTGVINSLFCRTPSPVTQEIIINELMSNYGYDKASAIHGIKQLEKHNIIEVTGQYILPRKLSKAEAVAHVLASNPEGLPWKDVVRVLNTQNYSSTLFDEARQAPNAFSGSEYIYLCGKGAYRNLLFLDLEQLDIPKTMQHLIAYFKQRQITASHLHDYYFQTKGQRSEIEYFSLRHLVREYGEDYGLYFEGKSGSDSISLDPDSKRITQSDVIIKVLNESNVAMTKQEIAERLRSKSINHASFYLDHLMEEGKVVRVDKMVYTTPENAFKNIDSKAVMQVVQEILNIKNVIVEADVFREYINMELNLSYSKYIYAALVSTQLKELGWFRHRTLFSKTLIPYKNLLDMCKQLCNPDLTNDENTKILQEAVWLSDAVTASVIQQWKLHLRTKKPD
ncbi:MAG: hypothetical protein R8K20_09205 [Gallionellaceae bacterium]